jgi:two-component system cell cycle response regulator
MIPINNPKEWTVLIVDDEPDNLSVAEKVLSFRGAKVHTATNGAEGLKVLEQIAPTFILMDLSMPRVDGWEMHRQVRENPRTTHIPVIALTAHAMEGDKERAMAAGFTGYIAKPFRLGTFFIEIEKCLQRVLDAASSAAEKE